MLPEVKVYKIDYDFIINNYLDKSLWHKTWNLFVYREHIFTLNLSQISIEDDSISFRIKKNGSESETIWYYPKNENINFLKRKINGAIFRLIEKEETEKIQNTQGYYDICESQKRAREEYRQEAELYLNDLKIDDEDFREEYIGSYVSRKDNYYFKKQSYIGYYQYNIYYDLFVEFCKATKDKSRLSTVMKNYHEEAKNNELGDVFNG